VAVTDSWFVLIVGATFVLYYLLLPFAEEPWLRKQYGPAYEQYYRDVPRFVGLRTARTVLT
jgi:protein-S-isoprenylcysteine O-methyltransferase Ste14